MRNPKRIKPFLEELGNAWEKVPDWRFGQLICNIPFDRDPFFLEEDEFMQNVNKLLDKNKVINEMDVDVNSKRDDGDEVQFEFYVLNGIERDDNKVDMWNIFNNVWVNYDVNKYVKKYVRNPNKFSAMKDGEYIFGFDALCEEIRRTICWQEWSRVEYEIKASSMFGEPRKIDCYDQAEKNIPIIARECIYQYKEHLKKNGGKNGKRK